MEDSPEPIHFVVKYKSEKFTLSMDPSSHVHDIFDYLGEVVDVNKENCVLIIAGKKFTRLSRTVVTIGECVSAKSTVMMMSSSVEEIEMIRNFKSDPLVKGFAEQERDEERRKLRAEQLAQDHPWGENLSQHPDYNFGRFEVLYRRSTPSPYNAEKLLRKLSIDPGILEIMSTQKFRVLTLCELDPEDADEEQAAKGEADKCLLGWNRNFGERIALRLRTDDFQSFRKYDSIVNTLIHELTHNVHGPHDANFWSLFNSLKQIYQGVHSKRRNAPLLSYSMATKDFPTASKQPSRPNTLGGTTSAKSVQEIREARLRFLEKPDR